MNYIYKITNDKNGKMYIGKTSRTVEIRFKEHINNSHKISCEKRPLYEAMRKYGIEHFKIETIEECQTDEEACIREQYWINELRTYIGFKDCNGYNATLGGDSKKYKQYNVDDMIEMYNETHNIKLICEKFNLKYSHALYILKDRIEILPSNEIQKELCKRKVYQIELNTLNIINIFRCLSEANLHLGKKKYSTNISDALKNRRGNHHAYGYDWYYEDDYLKLCDQENINKNKVDEMKEQLAS